MQSITFVCCVESGPLEFQTQRLVQSIRRWGGRFASAPIMAVTPRPGLPIGRSTQQIFERYNVDHIVEHVDDPLRWFGYLNKCKAVEIADARAKTDLVVWLDSDIIVVREPDDLLLDDGIDVACCPTSKTVATSGPGDSNEEYWEELCALFDIAPDQMGWVSTVDTDERIRSYFNSGVISFRRGKGFGSGYRDANMRVVQRGPVHPKSGIFYSDQVALALQLAASDLTWRELAATHNLTMRPELEYRDPDILASTAIIHYRGSMWPEPWPRMLSQLRPYRPDVVDWLKNFGPIENATPVAVKVGNKLLSRLRQSKCARWERLGRTANI